MKTRKPKPPPLAYTRALIESEKKAVARRTAEHLLGVGEKVRNGFMQDNLDLYHFFGNVHCFGYAFNSALSVHL
jgi:hypothetical protein